MQYGIIIQSGDARNFGELAREAEDAGWDAVFVADAIDIEIKKGSPYPMFDPWVLLAAMAMRTERIRIGTLLTPASRRRPWKLARETTTLDHLSGGRLTFAVGLGAAKDDGGFHKVGEAMELKVRAELLDESLEILKGLWSGKPFSFSGEHYKVQEMTMLPPPVQSNGIPVWVVGVWPKQKSMERALRWDGIIPQKYKATPVDRVSPADIRAIKKFVDEHHPQPSNFDILAGSSTAGKSRKRAAEIVRPFAEEGATWWLEEVWAAESKLLAHIKQGPPRID